MMSRMRMYGSVGRFCQSSPGWLHANGGRIQNILIGTGSSRLPSSQWAVSRVNQHLSLIELVTKQMVPLTVSLYCRSETLAVPTVST